MFPAPRTAARIIAVIFMLLVESGGGCLLCCCCSMIRKDVGFDAVMSIELMSVLLAFFSIGTVIVALIYIVLFSSSHCPHPRVKNLDITHVGEFPAKYGPAKLSNFFKPE